MGKISWNYFSVSENFVEINLVQVKIDIRDAKKRTPLLLAAMNGHLLVVSYLAHMGADIDAADSSENSVIHYAGE